MRHTGDGHEALLASLDARGRRESLSGSPLAGCPACAELVELERRLARLGTTEREELRADAGARGEAGERGRAEDALRARILADVVVTARRPVRRRMALVLVALAAAAALVLVFRSRRAGEPVPDVRMGDTLQLLEPLGAVDDFTVFRWTAVPGAAWYEIAVEPRGGGARSTSGRVTGTSWQPTKEQRERWGQRIDWTVSAYGAAGAGDHIVSAAASAQRSSSF